MDLHDLVTPLTHQIHVCLPTPLIYLLAFNLLLQHIRESFWTSRPQLFSHSLFPQSLQGSCHSLHLKNILFDPYWHCFCCIGAVETYLSAGNQSVHLLAQGVNECACWGLVLISNKQLLFFLSGNVRVLVQQRGSFPEINMNCVLDISCLFRTAKDTTVKA